MRSTLSSAPSKSAFGEQIGVIMTPQFQYCSQYGKLNNEIITSYNSNGTNTSSGGLVSVGINTTNGAYSIMQSKRLITYNPGQGGCARFTCSFNAGVASSTQLAGVGNSFNGFFFGYNGTQFGILRRYGGRPEIRKLTISSAFASTTTITITLNSVAITATNVISAGGSFQFSAFQIVQNSRTNFLNAGWLVENIGADVIFTNIFDGAKSGTYSVNWGSSSGNGSFTQPAAGVSATNSWISQTSWKYDTMNGLGYSKMTIDPTKINVYEIKWQYLGAGKIFFSIEDNDASYSGFQLVHAIEYPNTYNIPSLENANLKMHYSIISSGSTTAMTLNMVSFAGFTEGIIRRFEPRYSITSAKTGITTEKALFILRNGNTYNNIFNCGEILLTSLTISTDGTKNATIKIYLSNSGTTTYGTSTSDFVTFSNVDSNNSIALYDTTDSTITNGINIYTFTLAKVDKLILDLTPLNIYLAPNDEITITGASSLSVDINTSISWVEIQ